MTPPVEPRSHFTVEAKDDMIRQLATRNLELQAQVEAQAEQLRIFEANCCYRHIELDDRARLTALKEQT